MTRTEVLIHGDCLNVLKRIPENSIDLVCADMPYGTTQCRWDVVIELAPLWKQLKRITKDHAAILLFAQTPFDKVLGASNLAMLKYEWIWEKTLATGFFNAKKMPMKAHENILVFYKKTPTYNPIKTTGHKRKTTLRMGTRSDCYGDAVKKTRYDSTERYPRSIVTFPRANGNIHPTQKPVELIKYLVRTYSNYGDIVLDFCMGSGTTGKACKISGRSFIGIEKDEKHFNDAKQRITNRFSDPKP